MANVDLSKYLGGRTGTWSVGGFTLPDYNITERVFAAEPKPTPQQPPQSIGGSTGAYGSTQLSAGGKIPTGQVLGADTSRSGITSQPPVQSSSGDSELAQLMKMAQDGSINPAQRTRLGELLDLQQQQQQGDYASQISEMYEPYKQELTNMEGTLQQGFNEESANLESQVANESKKYDTQGQELTSATQLEEDKFNKTLQGALAEAIRSYNALKQQATARFGGASSAGQAVGELANQEFFRQQGATAQSGVEGAQRFAQEFTKIKSYVQQKKDDLDEYKKQALTQLRSNLADKLQEIRLRKADVEANKTRDRLAILQSTIEQARQVASADKQFRQNLGLAAVSKLQEVSGRQFTPQEWASYINSFMSEFEKTTTPTNIGAGSVSGVGGQQIARRTTGQDELAALQGFT